MALIVPVAAPAILSFSMRVLCVFIEKEVQHSTVVSVLTGMSVFKHPGIIIRVYGFKIFVLKNGTARCSFS